MLSGEYNKEYKTKAGACRPQGGRMRTERRKSRRLPVALNAVLNHRSQSVICTLRDLSLDGAFVDADSDLLPYAGTVELGFALPGACGGNPIRVPAAIRRTTREGAAVSFIDVGREAYFGLVDFVFASTAPVSHRAG